MKQNQNHNEEHTYIKISELKVDYIYDISYYENEPEAVIPYWRVLCYCIRVDDDFEFAEMKDFWFIDENDDCVSSDEVWSQRFDTDRPLSYIVKVIGHKDDYPEYFL